MSAWGPRHRVRPSELTRRAEQKVLGSFIAMAFMIAFLICFAVATDNVLLVSVSSIGAVIGAWLGRGRKVRRRKHAASR